MTMDISTITGWTGALLVLLCFYLTVARHWKADSGRYMLLSNVAAVFLIINAWMKDAYPFLTVNLALIVFTVYTLIKKRRPQWA